MRAPSKNSWPILGTLSQKTFLSRYWQKRPLLMRKALFPFPDIITPEEVAGMSCDPRIESRLIREQGGKIPWELQRGPFKPSLFKKLPPSHWTILVNGVDRFVPSVQALAEQFSFVPFWRMDDIMISYAVDQGNVGAHVDNYDVFLVQAHGRREWMIEDKPRLTDDFIPDLPIRLLRRFKPTHRWVLEPGDILYLPPRVPHHGVAQGDGCMTISVGFRAPSHEEILNSLVAKALADSDTSTRFSDPDLSPQQPGEISPQAISKIKKIVSERLLSDDFIANWLGEFATETYPDVQLVDQAVRLSAAQLTSALRKPGKVVRAEGARLAFIRKGQRKALFFFDSQRMELSGRAAELGELLSNHLILDTTQVKPFMSDVACRKLLLCLLAGGLLVLEES